MAEQFTDSELYENAQRKVEETRAAFEAALRESLDVPQYEGWAIPVIPNLKYKNCPGFGPKFQKDVRFFCRMTLLNEPEHAIRRAYDNLHHLIQRRDDYTEQTMDSFLNMMRNRLNPDEVVRFLDLGAKEKYTAMHRAFSAFIDYVRAVRARFLAAIQHPDPSALTEEDRRKREVFAERRAADAANLERQAGEIRQKVPRDLKLFCYGAVRRYRERGHRNRLQILPEDVFRRVMKFTLNRRPEDRCEIDDMSWPTPSSLGRPQNREPDSSSSEDETCNNRRRLKRVHTPPGDGSSARDSAGSSSEGDESEGDELPRPKRSVHPKLQSSSGSSSDGEPSDAKDKKCDRKKSGARSLPRIKKLRRRVRMGVYFPNKRKRSGGNRFGEDAEEHKLPPFPAHLRDAVVVDSRGAAASNEAVGASGAGNERGPPMVANSSGEDSDDSAAAAGAPRARPRDATNAPQLPPDVVRAFVEDNTQEHTGAVAGPSHSGSDSEGGKSPKSPPTPGGWSFSDADVETEEDADSAAPVAQDAAAQVDLKTEEDADSAAPAPAPAAAPVAQDAAAPRVDVKAEQDAAAQEVDVKAEQDADSAAPAPAPAAPVAAPPASAQQNPTETSVSDGSAEQPILVEDE